eukprot:gene44620-2483_t
MVEYGEATEAGTREFAAAWREWAEQRGSAKEGDSLAKEEFEKKAAEKDARIKELEDKLKKNKKKAKELEAKVKLGEARDKELESKTAELQALAAVKQQVEAKDAELAAARAATAEVDVAAGSKRNAAKGALQEQVAALSATAESAQQIQQQLDAVTGEKERFEHDCAAAVARRDELEEMFKEERTKSRRYFNAMEDMKGKVRVYVRTRPFLQSEQARGDKN